MKVLVLGYGAAGKRHTRGLRRLGCEVHVYDPYKDVEYNRLARAWEKSWDLVVVASPPDQHLTQIQEATGRGYRVLCEKPLCALGQEGLAREVVGLHKKRVMMAYNYRYHAAFWQTRINTYREPHFGYELVSRQSRKSWPEWGFLLDNLAHAVDILSWIADSPLQFTSASHEEDANSSLWLVRGKLCGTPFTLRDEVYHAGKNRSVYLKTPERWLNLFRDLGMFERMWRYCLDWQQGKVPVPYPDLRDAYRVQMALAEIATLAGGA